MKILPNKFCYKKGFEMKILAIDTATEVCSVAVLEDKDVILEKTLEAVNTHSVALMPLIKDVLSEANLTLNDIDLFACDKGPRFFYWN